MRGWAVASWVPMERKVGKRHIFLGVALRLSVTNNLMLGPGAFFTPWKLVHVHLLHTELLRMSHPFLEFETVAATSHRADSIFPRSLLRCVDSIGHNISNPRIHTIFARKGSQYGGAYGIFISLKRVLSAYMFSRTFHPCRNLALN